MLIRQTAPVFGAASDPIQEKGAWQLNLAYRGLDSQIHYSGSERQRQRERAESWVVNTQQALDIGATYAVTDRLSLSLGIPLIKATWAVPTPIAPVAGPRFKQEGSGLGDVSLTGRYWVFEPTSPKGNLSLGLGVKAPTGDHHVTQVYPNIDGTNASEKAVDQSVQPGDGGWGVLIDLQGFRRAGEKATLFASGTYLMNPRDTNGTPSIIVGLGLGGNPLFAGEGILVNSVPDQYLVRLGVAAPLGKNVGVSAAYRVEGLPRYDLIGDSHGWRRPGYEMFIEPGITYSKGPATWSLNVPIGFYRNREPNPYSGREGDATFPDYIFLTGLSYRF